MSLGASLTVPANELPWALKYRFGYDRRACALLSRIFNELLGRLMRRKAKAELGLGSVKEAHAGAVTFVQRADAALRLSPHLHVLGLDGVYVRGSSGSLEFRAVSDPTPDEMQWVAEQVATRVLSKLELEEVGQDDGYHHEEPLLAHLYGSSASGTEAVGPRQGRPVTRVLGARVEQQDKEGPVLGQCEGFGVYADRALDGRDRQRLFQMCRYLTRPPVAQARLTEMRDGRLCYRLKRVFRDGTSAVVLSCSQKCCVSSRPMAGSVRCTSVGTTARPDIEAGRPGPASALPSREVLGRALVALLAARRSRAWRAAEAATGVGTRGGRMPKAGAQIQVTPHLVGKHAGEGLQDRRQRLPHLRWANADS